MNQKKPYFVISLDFELFWGMTDKVTLKEYGARILGVRKAIPRMLELFKDYELHATWATLGMLMHEGREELFEHLPKEDMRPYYTNPNLSSYNYIESATLGKNEEDDPYHFGPSLVKKILDTPHQEIASHTYSHYYCVDGGENGEAIFAADCDAFARMAKKFGIAPKSIVFPRNQTTSEALRVCKEHGIVAYRGNEEHFLYQPRKDSEQSLFIRGIRLLDHYLNLSGHHTYPHPTEKDGVINVPASRFLRPWSKALSFLEPLRIRRIKNAMTHAAKRGEVFHLWWHPHNFGADLEENMQNLTAIANHYQTLNEKYGMQSATMSELADNIVKS